MCCFNCTVVNIGKEAQPKHSVANCADRQEQPIKNYKIRVGLEIDRTLAQNDAQTITREVMLVLDFL